VPVRLFAGDDWAEDHHDVAVMDEAGKVLARGRLPEGVAGMARLHALVGGCLGITATLAANVAHGRAGACWRGGGRVVGGRLGRPYELLKM
jgi:hypothetical protein